MSAGLPPERERVLFLDMAYDPPIPMNSANADLFECPNCGTQVVTGFGTFSHDSHVATAKEIAARVINKQLYRSFENERMRRKYYGQEIENPDESRNPVND